ncbi:MAG: DUF6807 family protein [Verrucomicrobiota bacterium]
MKQSIVIPAVLLASITWAGAQGFKDTEGKYLDILQGDKPLVRYMYEYDLSTPVRRLDTYKVWHHVMDETGENEITKGPGGKFPHHRAIYIGWSKLQHGGKGHDLWHMKGKAAQIHKEVLKQDSTPGKSTLSTQVHWLTSDGETVCLDETRTVTVHHNDKDAHLVLDFETDLKAVNGDVDLRGDPEHAGFQYRPHNDVVGNKSARYTFHAEGVNAKNTKDHPWVNMTYELKGRKYSVQHMNHPDNPKGTKYSAYRDYGRFGAFFQQPIKDGESLKLKYRIRITLGDTPSGDVMAEQYKAYIGS